MASLPAGLSCTLAQLQAASWSLIQGAGEDLQLWSGALDNGESSHVWWHSSINRRSFYFADAGRAKEIAGMLVVRETISRMANTAFTGGAGVKTGLLNVMDQTVLEE